MFTIKIQCAQNILKEQLFCEGLYEESCNLDNVDHLRNCHNRLGYYGCKDFVKILEGNSEFYTEECIGTVCYLIIIICILIRAFGNKCPHCSKTIMDNGEFCSRCGMKIK